MGGHGEASFGAVSTAQPHLRGGRLRALGTPAFRDQFNAQGVELMQSTPAAFASYVRTELARWSKVLKEMGINEAP